MPSRHQRPPAPRAAAVVLTSCALAGAAAARPTLAAAQPVLGASDDATIPAPGQARARGQAVLTNYGSTFGTGALRGIGGRYSTDSLGPTQFPQFAAARDTLRAITGNRGLALSLGQVRVAGAAQVISVPVQLEVGVARRFALGLVVPFNRTRTTAQAYVNPGGTTGNFGFNPASTAVFGTSAATPLAQNGRVVGNLTTAAASLRNAGATALADSIATFASGLGSVYGTPTRVGATVAPIAGSDAQLAVVRRLRQYAASAAARGVTLDSTVVPYPAQARIGTTGFRRLIGDPAFDIAALDSLGGIRRESIGDVELTAMLQWLDTFGGAGTSRGQARARATATRAVRSTLVGGFRFGTGRGERPEVLFDVPPAEGANAILLRSFTDVVVSRRLSATGIVRLAVPLGDTQTLRVPVALDSGYVPIYRARAVGRRLGRELQLEFVPRYAAGEAFAVWGQALVRTRQADRYTGQFTATAEETGATPITFDASPLGGGTAQREARAGLGIAYSTVAAWSRGRARLPVEVSYLHAVTAAGSGATQPRFIADVLSLRVFAALRGR